MKAHSGREIPDPPLDPEARRRWKTIYFSDLYGSPPDEIMRYLYRSELSPAQFRRRQWYCLAFVIGLLLLAAYGWLFA